ncbi:type II toxin-antitoxin system YafQ family toxin [Candidatus Peregrinibacteria bacterium]|nr:type II toxin-antitoxin system YafQ family toxin [Candidatus Peregrinibacteria bacterium]
MKMVIWRKSFKKDFKKLSKRQKSEWVETLTLFEKDSHHPHLRRHKLAGQYEGLESIDAMPDLRAVFLENDNFFVFYYLRNHSQLYD